MDVLVEINDDLGQKALKRAKNEGFSSVRGWISHLVTKEVDGNKATAGLPLSDILADEQTAERDVEFPRAQEPLRGLQFD